MKRCLHVLLLSIETAIIFAIAAVLYCNTLPMADACYLSEPTRFRVRLKRAERNDWAKLSSLRVDYTTREHPERDSHGSQMIYVKLTDQTRFETHEVELPCGAFAVGVSFHFADGATVEHACPELEEFAVGDHVVMTGDLIPYRNGRHGFDALYYVPRTICNGYFPIILKLSLLVMLGAGVLWSVALWKTR